MLPPKSLVKEIPTTQVAAMVTRVFMLKNRTVDGNTLIFMANEMQKLLRDNYYYLSVEEVKKALENGVYGRYGEYYEIGVVTICKWLDAYLNSDERREYVDRHQPKLLAIAQKATITDEERDKGKRKLLFSKFDTYRKTRRCETLIQITYQHLIEYGFINPTIDEKYAALDRATKILLEQKHHTHALKLRDLLTKMSNEQSFKDMKISIAKRLLVEDFFREIIETNKVDFFIKKLNVNEKKTND